MCPIVGPAPVGPGGHSGGGRHAVRSRRCRTTPRTRRSRRRSRPARPERRARRSAAAPSAATRATGRGAGDRGACRPARTRRRRPSGSHHAIANAAKAAVRCLDDEVVIGPVVGEGLQALVFLDGQPRGREGGPVDVDAGGDLVGCDQRADPVALGESWGARRGRVGRVRRPGHVAGRHWNCDRRLSSTMNPSSTSVAIDAGSSSAVHAPSGRAPASSMAASRIARKTSVSRRGSPVQTCHSSSSPSCHDQATSVPSSDHSRRCASRGSGRRRGVPPLDGGRRRGDQRRPGLPGARHQSVGGTQVVQGPSGPVGQHRPRIRAAAGRVSSGRRRSSGRS